MFSLEIHLLKDSKPTYLDNFKVSSVKDVKKPKVQDKSSNEPRGEKKKLKKLFKQKSSQVQYAADLARSTSKTLQPKQSETEVNKLCVQQNMQHVMKADQAIEKTFLIGKQLRSRLGEFDLS